MWLKACLALSLVVLPSALTEDGCGGSETPIPTPTPLPGDSDFGTFQTLLSDIDSAGTSAEKQALVDTFFRDIAYSGGFPIIEDSSVTFVMQAEGITAPIRVAGDFNGWDANQYTLTQTPGFNLHYITLDLSGAPDRSLYKYIGRAGGTDTYVADPHSRRFQFDEFGQYSLIDGGASQSHLERYPLYESGYLPSPRDLILYMPAGYEAGMSDLPVIYMHDGQNLFDPNAFFGGWGADDVADDMINSGELEALVMVGMANSYDRFEEYTHTEEFLPAYGGIVGGDGLNYASMIVDDIMPFVEARYRVTTDRADTGVLGSSLGGLISYYIGWLYPEEFAFVGGMSSTFGWGKINLDNDTLIDLMADTPKRDQVFYLDSGGGVIGTCENDSDGDGIWDDNESAGDNYCETLQMKVVLDGQGYTEGQDLFYVHAPGAEHNEAEWNARMDDVFRAFSQR